MIIKAKKRTSKRRAAEYADLIKKNSAKALLRAGAEAEAAHENTVAIPAEGSLVFISDRKGGGNIFIVVDGKLQELEKGTVLAREIAKRVGAKLEQERAPSTAGTSPKPGRDLAGNRYWVRKDNYIPLERSDFEKRLNSVIESAEVSRKAPGIREFVRGLREIVQR